MDRSECVAADADDVFATRRDRFFIPDDVRYLDGNSLGAMQPAVASRIQAVVEQQWGQGLIRSWNDAGWVDLPQRVADRLAPLVGASADEIAVGDSTSVNLYKALVAARRLRPGRRVLVTDDANFPTDLYVAHGVAQVLGDLEVRMVPSDQVLEALDDDVAVLTLTEVDYRSGRRYDVEALTEAAHAVGAVTVWDLSHSTGALAVDLDGWNADFAVGCSYKYLNGGPGAPAYLFVAARHHHEVGSPVQGWFGHAEPFAFTRDYEPAAAARRFLGGTPSIIATSALDTALEAFEGVDLAALEAKAGALTSRFIDLVDAKLGDEVEVVTPTDPSARGAQVSLHHDEAYAITQALIAEGVIGDHRPPGLVRFGFAPLYVRHVDVFDSAEILADVVLNRVYEKPEFQVRQTVT